MADTVLPSTIDTVLSTSLADYRRTLIDNIFNGIPLWTWFNVNGRVRRVDGGITHIEHPMFSKSTAVGGYKGYGTLDTTPQEFALLAEYEWQQAYATITISRREERQNAGGHKLIDLLAAKTQHAEMSLRDKLGSASMKVTTGFNEFEPLSALIDSTGTVGGLAQSSNSWWASTETASGSFASQGLSDMRTLFNTISADGSSDHPDAIFSTQSVFEFYEALLEPKERIMNTMMADAGIRNLEFKGIPFTYDQYCDSGILYMLNSKYLSLVIDDASDFVTTEFVRPTNQDAKTAAILFMGLTSLSNRRRQGKLTGITA